MHGEGIDAVGGVDLEQAPGHPFAPLGVDVGDQLGAGKVGLHHVGGFGVGRGLVRRDVRRERLRLAGLAHLHGQLERLGADGQVKGVDIAARRAGLAVQDKAERLADRRHRLCDVLGAVGLGALRVEAIGLRIDGELRGEAKSAEEAAAGF